MPKSLQQLKDELSAIGRAVCEEGMTSPENQGDELFQAVNNIFQAKRAIEKVIDERQPRFTDEEVRRWRNRENELMYGIPNPDSSTDRGNGAEGRGVVGGDQGEVHLPGATQAHDEEPQK